MDLDVLFVGAHPDHEAGTLSTLGQWRETNDIRTDVVTITRGEGGGNAVGPEEGPALGLIREGEERRAVGKAGVTVRVAAPRAGDLGQSTVELLTPAGWTVSGDGSLGRIRPGSTAIATFSVTPPAGMG